jgi:dolichyl-phosphate-mannose--protein O-mannosyl transferase
MIINASVKYTGLFALGCVGLLALCDIWQIVGDLAVDKVSYNYRRVTSTLEIPY